jgi:hypothetical protein
MCKRSTDDPLVRAFLDDYGINLLRVPRENACCGDLYVKTGRSVSGPGDVAELFDPAVRLPRPRRNERLADLSGKRSTKIDLKVGIGLLDAFLAAIGAAGVLSKLKASFDLHRVGSVSFAFRDATRDSVDPLKLGTALGQSRLKTDHPFVQPESEYFVTAAVVRTPSISVMLDDDRSQSVDLGADAVHAISVEAGISGEHSSSGEITFAGTTPLAIGVQLYSMRFDAQTGKLSMAAVDRAQRVGARPPKPAPAFVAEDDEALLSIDTP